METLEEKIARVVAEHVDVVPYDPRWPAMFVAERDHLLACLPAGLRGTDLLAETTLGKLREAIEHDVFLKAQLKDPIKALERGLLWLHEQDVIRLNKGLAVFRTAMTIKLVQEKVYERNQIHLETEVRVWK